jgi:TonB family protein
MDIKKIASLVLFSLFCYSASAQHDQCEKCDMLREEYDIAQGDEKARLYEFFKQECLQQDTVFVGEQGQAAKQQEATSYQVRAKGKCIDYQEVKEFEVKTKKETRSYKIQKKDTVYTFATTQPSFPGGVPSLIRYISDNVRYPEQAKANRKQGTVYLQIVVDKSGSISSIKTVRSPDKELTNEAVRIVKSMPKWEPAKFKTVPVSMVYVLPVKFTLR